MRSIGRTRPSAPARPGRSCEVVAHAVQERRHVGDPADGDVAIPAAPEGAVAAQPVQQIGRAPSTDVASTFQSSTVRLCAPARAAGNVSPPGEALL